MTGGVSNGMCSESLMYLKIKVRPYLNATTVPNSSGLRSNELNDFPPEVPYLTHVLKYL